MATVTELYIGMSENGRRGRKSHGRDLENWGPPPTYPHKLMSVLQISDLKSERWPKKNTRSPKSAPLFARSLLLPCFEDADKVENLFFEKTIGGRQKACWWNRENEGGKKHTEKGQKSPEEGQKDADELKKGAEEGKMEGNELTSP